MGQKKRKEKIKRAKSLDRQKMNKKLFSLSKVTATSVNYKI
jgi:hypothetical protein